MSEKKYIDAEELNKLLCEAKNSIPAFNGGICKARMIAKKMPAADVEEVKHGVWLESDNPYPNGIQRFMCSCCSRTLLTRPEWDLLLRFPYCHCGARMQKEKEE